MHGDLALGLSEFRDSPTPSAISLLDSWGKLLSSSSRAMARGIYWSYVLSIDRVSSEQETRQVKEAAGHSPCTL